jgi:hypothetical protein
MAPTTTTRSGKGSGNPFGWLCLGLYVLALVLGLGGLRLSSGAQAAPPVAQWLLLLSVGVQGLVAAYGHLLRSEEVAASIGWSTNPFQIEIGYANLGLGLAGVVTPWLGVGGAWAVACFYAPFTLGAAAGHIRELCAKGNVAPNNAGPILWIDVLAPLTLLAALVLR